MNFKFLTEDIEIQTKKLIAVTILVSSSFAWLFIFFNFFANLFQSAIANSVMIGFGYSLFLGSSAFSALLGSVISEKVNRRTFLFAWITLGLSANISLIFSQGFGVEFFLFISAVLGVSIGLGFPTCLAFLTECTAVEERARVTGIAILVTLAIAIPTFIIGSVLSYGIVLIILLCAVRATSFLALALDSCDWKKKKINSWQIVLTRKDFALYLFPWLMFSITGGLQGLIESGLPKPLYATATTIGYELHYLGWAAFGLLSGIMADRVGRRQPIIIGLVLLGVSFWVLSLVTNPLTVIIYELFSGLAWGSLFTVYITVLGDLAFDGSRERFYALGAVMPIIITLSVQTAVTLLGISLPREILTPVLSIVLFASVLPVLRASETLSSAKILSRKMKEHVEKVGKLVKESKKTK